MMNDNDLMMIKQVIIQDIQEHYGEDEVTLSLINMMRLSDKVYKGRDEDTLNLSTKLNNEAIAEGKKYEQERGKKVKVATAKNKSNFPPLSKTKPSNQ